ncbi:MAG: helix-turn-helix domain-containing protein [Candidatus Kariarchaeaceae archaeon]|jgi:hypothetical protein
MAKKSKYEVRLTKLEREYLETYLRSGRHSTRMLNRVRVLLLSDSGELGPKWTDKKISEAIGFSHYSVWHTRKKFTDGGVEGAIRRKNYDKEHRERKLDGEAEAKMIALLMSKPPEGKAKWTLRLMASKMIELDIVDDISHEGVRLYLKKMNLSLGTRNRG